jgi:organic radical activating enzyme
MNLLTVSLIMSCNRECYYCPVKRWKRPFDDAKTRQHVNLITNAALLKWLDAYLDPREWYIELTGGEPGLYPEIDALITELACRGYYGMVKTNGSLPISANPNFTRVTAWHEGVKDIPQYYDQIVIIEIPTDNWREKVKYCKEHNIPHHTTLFDRLYENNKISQAYCRVNKVVKKCLHINSAGKITPCAKGAIDVNHNIFNMSPPVPLNAWQHCPRCKNINDVEKFIPEDFLRN